MKINPDMKKLGHNNFLLISDAVHSTGSFHPDEILFFFEEKLYTHQSDTIVLFLKWVADDEVNRCFGSGNYEKKFKEFLETNKK